MANENELILEEFYASSFMQIEKSRPVVIDFTARKKNQNFIEFVGDMKTGKSSRLMGILYAMGARLIDKKLLINTTDNALEEGLKFRWNGVHYHVIVKTNRVEVKKFNEKADKWSVIDEEPMTFLRDVFGPVSLSPFEVRNMKGKKQIEYMQTVFGSDENASKKMQKLEDDTEAKFTERTQVNSEVKALQNALELEPLYNNYEKTSERFKVVPTAEKQKKAFEEAQTKNNEYNNYKNQNLPSHRKALSDKQQEIIDLKKKLADAEKAEVALQNAVKTAETWVEKNKNIPVEFEKIQKDWMDLSKNIADYDKWKSILVKEKLFNERQEKSIELTNVIEENRVKILKLTKECLPKVEGLEIKVAVGLDKTKQEEGVFYKGKSISILSESEYVELWCLIYDAAGVNIIVLENLTSMGSDTVATLNALAKGGAQIFASRVDRKQKDVKVVFSSKIE